jgi:hypothetical protein
MPTNPKIVPAAYCITLASTFTADASTAKQHLATKHHALSEFRPWDANAALVSTPSNPWWARLDNGAGSALRGH